MDELLLSGRNDSMVIDMGPPADWVKINVRRTVSIVISVLQILLLYVVWYAFAVFLPSSLFH